jgi:hypothetical protein
MKTYMMKKKQERKNVRVSEYVYNFSHLLFPAIPWESIYLDGNVWQ